MNKQKWTFELSLILVGTSILIYATQFMVFHNSQDTFFYFFQDLAFVPISVLLVTLVIDNLMKKREKQSLINKMNMVVGIFFSEMGYKLLHHMADCDTNSQQIRNLLADESDWDNTFLAQLEDTLKNYHPGISLTKSKLEKLKTYLLENRPCLMRMLENPNLLEHETFTDLLWAVSHLTEELKFRSEMHTLTEDDLKHLANDMNRAYSRLLIEWLAYIRHLKTEYPYMFKLAVMDNPFIFK